MNEDRYEPGPTAGYGSSGIPREGMTERYATAMWRDDPGAFWLHPEGPLSDTTPEEYFVPRPPVSDWQLNYAAMGIAQTGYASQMSQMMNLQQAANYSNYSNAQNSVMQSAFPHELARLMDIR